MNDVKRKALKALHDMMQCKQNAAKAVFGEIEIEFGPESENPNRTIVDSARAIRDRSLTASRKQYDIDMQKAVNDWIQKATLIIKQ